MTVFRWLIGVLLTVALAWMVDAVVGWLYVWDSWQLVSAVTIVQFLLLFTLSHVMRAWRIYSFKAYSLGLGYRLTLKLSLVHQSLNNLLPMRLGEASYPLLMKRYGSISLVDASLDLVWLRILDIIVMGSLGVFVIVSYVSAALAAGVVVLGLVASCALLSLAQTLSSPRQALIDQRLTITSTLARLGARGPSSMARLWWLLLLTLGSWAAKIVAIAMLSAELVDLPWLTLLGGIVAGEVSGILPLHGVAGAGTYEAAFVAGAMAGGDSLHTLLLASVSVHVFVISTTCFLAVLSLPLGGRLPHRKSQ